MNINTTTLAGHVTRHPEIRHAGQSAVCKIGLAVNTRRGEREDVLFIDLEAWGRTGEIIAQYVHKGDALGVTGRLRLETWEDKGGGGKRSKIVLVVDQVWLGARRDRSDTHEAQVEVLSDDDAVPF